MSFSYKAILFDCDGVIVDTETLSSSILKRKLDQLGLTLDDHTMHIKFAGFTTEENLKVAATMLGKPLPEDFYQEYRNEFNQSIIEHLEPIDGVTELLALIKCPIAMATNAKRAELELKLELIGLAEKFKVRFAVDDVAQGKPEPDLYLKAAEALGVSPTDCIVIEDSIAGIRAGKAAGATVLGFCSLLAPEVQIQAGASATFRNMKELIELLDLK